MINLQQRFKNQKFQKKLTIFFVLMILLISFSYWWYSSYYVSTDDAYVNANVVQIAPRVTGEVVKLYITNNQFVKKNQILFQLDLNPFNATLHEAQANLALRQAQLNDAEVTAKRVLDLVNKKVSSPQSGDDALTAFQVAQAQVLFAQASLVVAKLNLSYATVIAPVSGWVSNVTLRVGDVVTKDQNLFVLISNEEFWVDANFKETDLENIHQGQKADIVLDMYQKKHFIGIVQSISGGSGTVFSLLPPENATGNWVKVTQRIPVRIKIINLDPQFPLHIGSTATVTIKIK